MSVVLTENEVITDFLREKCQNNTVTFTKIVTNLLEDYQIKKDIEEAMIEVKEAKEGKRELKNAFTLLKELQDLKNDNTN